MVSIFSSQPVLKIVEGSVVVLPSPKNISYFWNFGSLLGVCLMSQILTGLLLAMHYSSSIDIAFSLVSENARDIQYGWFVRVLHMNGASAFFICLYMHIGRGIYYNSFKLMHVWGVGVIILLIVMATAFLGYVLPWGQMSFWGAAVITSLLSTIPVFGGDVVMWLWGDFGVSGSTLMPFFTLHFLLPFLVAGLAMVHLLYLHQTGSNNPLGLNSNMDKLVFYKFFTDKDLLGFVWFILVLFNICMLTPWLLGDPENFIMADSMKTPVHIQPEWYFLFAYAILRSIPNKFGGVVALALSVLVLLTLPLMPKSSFFSNSFYPMSKTLFWGFSCVVILLTWVGARPVEAPYVFIGQILTGVYFLFYVAHPVFQLLWDSFLD